MPHASAPRVWVRPAPAPETAHVFREQFSDERLAGLRKQFGASAPARLLRSRHSPCVDKALSAARQLNRTPPADAYRPARVLVETVNAYLAPDHMAGLEKKAGKQGPRAAALAQRVAVMTELKKAAETFIAHQFAPDPRPLMGTSQLSALRRALEQRAALLARNGGSSSAQAGTSDVALIRNTDGSVAYAFKPLTGESAQNLAPPGGGALREELCSVFNTHVFETTGLDLGFPKVSLAVHKGQYGALIDGVPGRNMDSESLLASAEPTAKGIDLMTKTRKLWDVQASRVDAAQLQKVMLANLAMGNVDIKWGNMMVDRFGHCRPIDGGTAFPSRCLNARVAAVAAPPEGFCIGPGEGRPLAAGDEPFDPKLRKQFLSIDADALEASLMAHRRHRLDTLPPSFLEESRCLDKELLLDEASVAAGIRSLRITQGILREAPDCSMRELAQRYWAQLKATVPPSDVAAFKRVSEQHAFYTPQKQQAFLAEFARQTGGSSVTPHVLAAA